MRIRPFRGKFVFRSTANRINDMFLSAPVPDYKELEKEAKEFEDYILEKRSAKKVSLSHKS